MGITRNVQTIIINREKEDERLDILPTRPPVVTAPRPTRIRVCANAEQDDVAVTTEVRYRYQVEIVPGRDELTDLNWSHDIPAWVNGATVDILAGHLCAETQEAEDPFQRHLLAPCVLSISSGFRDVFLNDDCTTAETLCALYSGTVRVTYTDLCTRSEIIDAVLDFVKGGTSESDLLQISNQISLQDDINLTSVVFSEHPVVPQETTQTEVPEENIPTNPVSTIEQDDASQVTVQERGLNGAGKAMVSLLGLVLLLMLALLYVWRQRERNKRPRKPDDDSFETECSSPSFDRNFIRPDNHNQHHTKTDVHHCSSGYCPVCRPRIGLLDMLSVDPRTPGKLKPVEELLHREVKDCDESSQESNVSVKVGGAARALFCDAESTASSTVDRPMQGPREPPPSYSLEDDMANTDPVYVKKDPIDRVDAANASVDADSLHTDGKIIEGADDHQSSGDSFTEILNDITYVRREEPESDTGSKQIDRPKLNPPGARLLSSVTL